LDDMKHRNDLFDFQGKIEKILDDLR